MLQTFIESLPPEVLSTLSDLNLDIKSPDCNAKINQLLKNSVLVGGKRLRPLLTFIMGHLLEIDSKKLIPYARSVELVHAASLSHDDVIDNATTRRGVPSINIQGDNKMAVLAGDFLLADVIVDLCQNGKLELVQEMAQVIQALAEGEWIQHEASKNKAYSREIIEEIAIKKTASVMSYCCVAPSILKNLPAGVIEVAREFGSNLGIAFQLIDDTLDFSNHSNKDMLLDLDNGVVNSVVFEWLEHNPILKKRFEDGGDLREIFTTDHLDESIQKVRAKALSHLERAKEALSVLISESEISAEHAEEAKKPLLNILSFLANREI
ncbi:MAG: polyprenyl synthetase family protein [Bdellovibrionales bacterium]|nr:polyprenyl synthetase family protein [Bdellovibrionales bacterium]